MAAFIKSNFDMGYGKVRYVIYNGEFVVRFKYGKTATTAKRFVKFLMANFTVEEYFEKLKNSTPYDVVKEKGYVW